MITEASCKNMPNIPEPGINNAKCSQSISAENSAITSDLLVPSNDLGRNEYKPSASVVMAKENILLKNSDLVEDSVDHVSVKLHTNPESHVLCTDIITNSQGIVAPDIVPYRTSKFTESNCSEDEESDRITDYSSNNNIHHDESKNASESSVAKSNYSDDDDDEPLSSISHALKEKSSDYDTNGSMTNDIMKNAKDARKLRKELEEELQNIYGENYHLGTEADSDDGDNDEDDSDEPLSRSQALKEKASDSDTIGSITNDTKKKSKNPRKVRKELEDELQNIHSENQRLARESTITLPYHKPKISSLSDFLNRKSTYKNLPASKLSKSTGNVLTTPKGVSDDNQVRNFDFKTPQLTDFKKKLLGSKSVLNTTPKLSPQADFLELGCSEIPKGVTHLMSRFIKHNQKKAENASQEIKMHLVCKDMDKDGHEDLKSKEITVKVMPDVHGTPFNSQNFSTFKEKLLSTITKKKLEKQETIMLACDLDNEEGFDESKSDSDESDVESVTSDSELEDVLPNNETEEETKTDEVQNSHSLENNLTEEKSGIAEKDVMKTQAHKLGVPNTCAVTDSQHLFLEDSTELPAESMKMTQDEMDTSFELLGSLIPAHQPGGGLKNGGYELSDDEACTLEPSNRTNTVFGKKSLEYDSETESPVKRISKEPFVYNKEGTESQNFNELLSLCSGRFSSPNESTPANSSTSITEFTKSPISSKNIKISRKSSDSQNYNELLALCSGKFSSTNTCSQSNELILETSSSENFLSNPSLKESLETNPSGEILSSNERSSALVALVETNKSDDEDDDDIIQSNWKKVARKSIKLNFDSDDECETENNENRPLYTSDKKEAKESDAEDEDVDEDADAEEEEGTDAEEEEGTDAEEEEETVAEEVDSHNIQMEESFLENGQTKTQEVTKVTDFFDQEAELSGSDAGSDDEQEDDEEEQIFDDAVPSDEEMSEEELRNQIGKVHLKRLMDDDKREVRFFQEVYLEDGDLHSDGNGRERKFRWSNVDHDNLGSEDKEDISGDEMEQNVLENEKWRVQRFEREKWLQEQETLNNESWTGFKLTKRNKSGSLGTPTINFSPNTLPGVVDQPKSFLTKNKDFCSRLAEKIQKQESEYVGRRSTKNFVFISKSPVKAVKRNGQPVHASVAKVRKLNTPALKNQPRKSVFNFI